MNKGLLDLKKRFRKAVVQSAETVGWHWLFAKYDADGGGGLDRQEFMKAVREGAGLDEKSISDADVDVLFSTVDDDGNGAIDLVELHELVTIELDAIAMNSTVFSCSIFELATLWMQEELPRVSGKGGAEISEDEYIQAMCNFLRQVSSHVSPEMPRITQYTRKATVRLV